jgi:choline dehydrogenase-like flavoprotein
VRARVFGPNETVDFVVVGSGAAGGVMAHELSRAGLSVLVLEQGPRLTAADFRHDEFAYWFNLELENKLDRQPQSFRRSADQAATAVRDFPAAWYAATVGGSSNHFTGNFWRFHENDFDERSPSAPSRERRSRTGRSATPTSNPITRRWTGRSACPGSRVRVRSTRRAAGPTRCRRCP